MPLESFICKCNEMFLQGYRQRGAYIATQAPMENTVNDFWRMVWDYQSRSIVLLCRMKEDGKVNAVVASLGKDRQTLCFNAICSIPLAPIYLTIFTYCLIPGGMPSLFA